MQTRICFIYPWATVGGVERVLLNRSLAFKKYLPEIKIDLLFLQEYLGQRPLEKALNYYELTDTATIINSLDQDYDLVSVIDCQQGIDLCEEKQQRFIVECHTSYIENRSYLEQLPEQCELVVTPSADFTNSIKEEIPPNIESIELCNFVPWDINDDNNLLANCLPNWQRKPILFLGRLDVLKDPLSLLDAFQILDNQRPGEYMLLFCGPRATSIDFDGEIARRSLEHLCVVLPAVAFNSTDLLLHSVAKAGGIYVSPSKAESFGLAAAEAIAALLPVVLSDIEAHQKLVYGFEQALTYRLNNTMQLAKRIESVFDNYQAIQKNMKTIRNKFSAKEFISDWHNLMNKLNIN